MVTRAPTDAEVVRRLRAAGAIVVGKTTMPELGLWPFTESVTWGVTRNPWDLERTPGGSSGGSAAAVAAGMVPTALGADAGAIRIPAACCGVFGLKLKPQRDRVSRTPHDRDGAHWVVFGALTRSVLDTGLMLDVLSAQRQGLVEAAQTQPGRMRIAVADDFPTGTRGRLLDEARGALDTTADLLRSLGHRVVGGAIDMKARDLPVTLELMFRFIHDLVGGVERPKRLERRTRAFARPGALVSDRRTGRLLAAESAMVKRLGAIFAEHDVLLTLVMSEPAVPAGIMEGRGATATYLWESSWVPLHGALEHHRPAGGLDTRRPYPRRPTTGGSTRRTTPRREDPASLARLSDRVSTRSPGLLPSAASSSVAATISETTGPPHKQHCARGQLRLPLSPAAPLAGLRRIGD